MYVSWADGSVSSYSSIEALISECGAHSFGNTLRSPSLYSDGYITRNRGIIRNQYGRIISSQELRDVFFPPHAYKARRYWRTRYLVDIGWNWEGPVPGVHKSPSSGYDRKVKTIAARRQAFVVKEEGEPTPRAKRNAANLPSDWDDLPRKSQLCNNWKRYRKTQWK